MREATLYKKTKNNDVKCGACSWRCDISENKLGVCGVRKNIKGKLFLLVYGKVVAVNIDPIEKKPLYHFLPGSKIYSIGTLGCNFGCGFCQNYDISQASKNDLVESWGKELKPSEIVEYCLKNNVPSIAFTYNEPTIFAEYVVDIMKEAKKNNIKGVFVTNSYETKEALNLLDDYIDAYNVDLKSFSDDYYRKICKAKLQPVLETIKEIVRRKKWLEITTLLIPGENDSEEEMTLLAKFIKNISVDIPWHVSAFYPTYKMTEKSQTSRKTLFSVYEIGKKEGLNFVYTGNISDNRFSSTDCPKCNFRVVEREGYFVNNKIINGYCPNCGQKIPGFWQ